MAQKWHNLVIFKM